MRSRDGSINTSLIDQMTVGAYLVCVWSSSSITRDMSKNDGSELILGSLVAPHRRHSNNHLSSETKIEDNISVMLSFTMTSPALPARSFFLAFNRSSNVSSCVKYILLKCTLSPSIHTCREGIHTRNVRSSINLIKRSQGDRSRLVRFYIPASPNRWVGTGMSRHKFDAGSISPSFGCPGFVLAQAMTDEERCDYLDLVRFESALDNPQRKHKKARFSNRPMLTCICPRMGKSNFAESLPRAYSIRKARPNTALRTELSTSIDVTEINGAYACSRRRFETQSIFGLVGLLRLR